MHALLLSYVLAYIITLIYNAVMHARYTARIANNSYTTSHHSNTATQPGSSFARSSIYLLYSYLHAYIYKAAIA